MQYSSGNSRFRNIIITHFYANKNDATLHCVIQSCYSIVVSDKKTGYGHANNNNLRKPFCTSYQ